MLPCSFKPNLRTGGNGQQGRHMSRGPRTPWALLSVLIATSQLLLRPALSQAAVFYPSDGADSALANPGASAAGEGRVMLAGGNVDANRGNDDADRRRGGRRSLFQLDSGAREDNFQTHCQLEKETLTAVRATDS